LHAVGGLRGFRLVVSPGRKAGKQHESGKLEGHAGAVGNDEAGTLSERKIAMTYKSKRIIRMMGWMNSKGSIIKIWYADHTTEIINDMKVAARGREA
jgi:hypothetical protein